jgi:nitrile hydratase
MHPAEYLATTYYEHWLFGLEKLLHEAGLVTRDELAARVLGHGAVGHGAVAQPLPDARALAARDVEATLRHSRASRADEEVPPRYDVGARVIAKNMNPVGHTRLPRYARGKRGVIALDHGVWVFADSSGNGLGQNPQHCYSVRFTARDLWGDGASAADAVYIDLWDDHLEPA